MIADATVGLTAPVFTGQRPEASGGRAPTLRRKVARGAQSHRPVRADPGPGRRRELGRRLRDRRVPGVPPRGVRCRRRSRRQCVVRARGRRLLPADPAGGLAGAPSGVRRLRPPAPARLQRLGERAGTASLCGGRAPPLAAPREELRRAQVMSSMRCERDAGPLGGVGVDGDLIHDLAARRVTRAPTPGAGRRCGTSSSTGRPAGRATTIVLSGCSAAMRCTMWISVPIAEHRARPAPARPSRGCARSSPTRSASSTTSCAHSGCTMTSTVRVLGAERRDVLGPEALVHRAVALPEQERRLLDVALLEPAELEARVPDPHVGLADSPCRSRCCGRGAGRGRRAPCRRLASAHSSTARAFDDVQTAPPCSPDERLQRGGRVHVGDRARPGRRR